MLLLFGFAGALRRSELVALRVEDVAVVPGGLRLLLPRGKTDQARAAALVGQSVACPFDLHALLPVPAAILLLGPTHPDAFTWLAAHWDVTDRLRQVAKASTGRRLPKGPAVIGYGFFTVGETPHAAIDHCARPWPTLRFLLAPRPAD